MPKGISLPLLCCRIHHLHPLLCLLQPIGLLAAGAALSPTPNSKANFQARQNYLFIKVSACCLEPGTLNTKSPPMPAFGEVIDVPLVVRHAQKSKAQVSTSYLGMCCSESTARCPSQNDHCIRSQFIMTAAHDVQLQNFALW